MLQTRAVAQRLSLPSVRRPCGAPARHPFTVLSFHIAGEMELEQGGPLTLRPGDLHVIPAGHAHRVVRAVDAEIWGVGVASSALDSERFDEVRGPIESMARGALPRVAIPPSRRPFVESLFAELADAPSGPAVRSESLVALLLAELAAHAPAIALEPSHAVDLASRAVSFIARHALGPLSLADVSRALGRHRSHVAEVVRGSTGQTVGELIADVRLDEACRRLEQTDELVEVIGERVGYPDATHFARMFRRRYGSSPRAWRRMLASEARSRIV